MTVENVTKLVTRQAGPSPTWRFSPRHLSGDDGTMKPPYPNGLKAAMDRKKIGYAALARELGKDENRQTVERWAKGARKLTVPMAEKIAPLLDTTPDQLLLVASSVTRVPLLEWVQAGRLREPLSQISVHEVPAIPVADLTSGEFFALRVQGQSMNRVSPDGSIILVNRAERDLVVGKPYIFAVRGETTYKLWGGGEPMHLAPYSTEPEPPIFIKRKRDLEVIGRVRRSILDL